MIRKLSYLGIVVLWTIAWSLPAYGGTVALDSEVLREPICDFPPHGIPFQCGVYRFPMYYLNNSGPPIYCNMEAGRYCIARAGTLSSDGYTLSDGVSTDKGKAEAIYSNPAIPPSPAFLHCDSYDATKSVCTVWPQGQLTYSWSATGGLQTQHPPSWSGHTQIIYCPGGSGSGYVSVNIVTPDNASDTAVSLVSCGGSNPQ